MQRNDIAIQARTWIGTRFHHQGRLKGARGKPGGVDCIGLLVGVVRELELKHTITDRTGKRRFLHSFDQTDYSPDPQGDRLKREISEYLDEIALDTIEPGDILLFKLIREPQHVGIVGDHPDGGLSLIHAYSPARKVCEHRLEQKWLRRVVGAYRLKEEYFG